MSPSYVTDTRGSVCPLVPVSSGHSLVKKMTINEEVAGLLHTHVVMYCELLIGNLCPPCLPVSEKSLNPSFPQLGPNPPPCPSFSTILFS